MQNFNVMFELNNGLSRYVGVNQCPSADEALEIALRHAEWCDFKHQIVSVDVRVQRGWN